MFTTASLLVVLFHYKVALLTSKVYKDKANDLTFEAKAKDLSFKAKAKDKDLTFKTKTKAKDLSFMAKDKDLTFKAKAKDLKIVLKDSLRPRPRTPFSAEPNPNPYSDSANRTIPNRTKK